MLFTLLTGRTPFDGDGAAGLAQHLHAPPPAPASLRPDTPPALNELVLALLAKDPTGRPTAIQAATALAALAPPTGRPAPGAAGATPTATTRVLHLTRQLPERAGGPDRPIVRRRRRWLLPATVGAVLLALTLLVLLSAGGGRPSAAPADPPTTTPGTASTSTPPVASPTSPPPTASDPAQAALDNLQAALPAAAASGALAAPDATDLSHRLSNLRQALTQGNTDHAVQQIADLDHHLTDLQRHGRLAPGAATQVHAALTDLRAALSPSTTTGIHGGDSADGGDGGD